MLDPARVITFVIVAFCLAIVLLIKRDSIPPQLKKGMALFALLMIVFSFFLVVYSFLQM